MLSNVTQVASIFILILRSCVCTKPTTKRQVSCDVMRCHADMSPRQPAGQRSTRLPTIPLLTDKEVVDKIIDGTNTTKVSVINVGPSEYDFTVVIRPKDYARWYLSNCSDIRFHDVEQLEKLTEFLTLKSRLTIRTTPVSLVLMSNCNETIPFLINAANKLLVINKQNARDRRYASVDMETEASFYVSVGVLGGIVLMILVIAILFHCRRKSDDESANKVESKITEDNVHDDSRNGLVKTVVMNSSSNPNYDKSNTDTAKTALEEQPNKLSPLLPLLPPHRHLYHGKPKNADKIAIEITAHRDNPNSDHRQNQYQEHDDTISFKVVTEKLDEAIENLNNLKK